MSTTSTDETTGSHGDREAIEQELTAGTDPASEGGLGHPVAKDVDGRPGVHYTGAGWKRIASVPIAVYLVMAGVVLTAATTGVLAPSMLSGFAVTILLGGLFIWLGNRVPLIRDYGLPTILCTFAPATLAYLGAIPEPIITVASTFIDEQGFLDFFVMAIIAGSILGMPRALLVKAGPRFAVPVVGTMVATFVVIGLVSLLFGKGFIEGILLVAAPIMAGGLGLGALPMSEMYASRTGQDASAFMGDLMSAVVLANVFCIIIAGLLNGIGKNRPTLFVGFTGNGDLMRVQGPRGELTMPKKADTSTYIALGKGLLFAAVIFVVGELLGAYLEFLHPYAWAIIIMVVLKLTGWLPKDLEASATDWGELINAVLVPALLVGVSLTYIKIDEVLVSLADPSFIVLTFLCVLVAGLSAGVIGWLVKFNFVESAIVPGLVMADTGGSGDVSVLSASERMHLMPFAAITNRIGGTLVLFVTSLMVPLLVG
ncbi:MULTISPECIES: 2-hydroxycarboxylate transporter family protein [Micrococcaceae]|uniref:2-hydroxycarboxylate transporter family protein n=1 Tax=Micrococcaceae TaxID=1268 RepID=UPI00160BBC6A|nr:MULTISPECIES: 2-hydroxycarboxylate transporter family protein [Micrococcaceae]MBB5750378.1 Na+/citrate or Na+/malate symporter [Micrococcus sp. TA1]HRO29755.1 2-hydroxycarboxylate transporter family protein [Citricoccus sp.]HRO94884.1 2-hydroxycarboxylate transporter family protein [Citricoccus sp.]